MSGERFLQRAGVESAPRSDDERFGGCLTDGALQAIADGTLRGPELMLAQQHLDECPRCSAEIVIYQGLLERLNQLHLPVLPPGFTHAVLTAVELREQTRDQRHRALLAALPAALIALGILFVWAFAADAGERVRDLIIGATIFERVAHATLSVLSAVRLPIGIAALLTSVAVFAALARQVALLRANARS